MFEPVSYMYYDGDLYMNPTGIILKDDYINTHTFHGKKPWKYYWFSHKLVNNNNQNAYFFSIHKCSFCDLLAMGYRDVEERNEIMKNTAPYIIIPCHEIHNAIEGFTNPIKVDRKEADILMSAAVENALHPKSDFEVPGMMGLWAVYILAMIGSLIFRQFYLLWIVETLLFVYLRKGVRGE